MTWRFTSEFSGREITVPSSFVMRADSSIDIDGEPFPYATDGVEVATVERTKDGTAWLSKVTITLLVEGEAEVQPLDKTISATPEGLP